MRATPSKTPGAFCLGISALFLVVLSLAGCSVLYPFELERLALGDGATVDDAVSASETSTCPAGTRDCDPGPALSCGACCSNADCTGVAYCSADRRCVAGCAPTQTECGGRCVALQSDPSHCGRCGEACPANRALCCNGACRMRCSP